MNENSLEKIKSKFNKIDSKLYWGDDYDVRFYLLQQLQGIENKTILDIGGGGGIISSELSPSNNCVNLDISFDDLKKCNKIFKNSIHAINASMTHMGFKEQSFDLIICSHVLEVIKELDIQNNLLEKTEPNIFPTINKMLEEIRKLVKPNGILFITTTNNAYYKTRKLSYDELKCHLEKNFDEFTLFFYNTYPKFSSNNRKLNMANVIPKLFSKIKNREKIIQSMIKNNSKNNYSVSFFAKVNL